MRRRPFIFSGLASVASALSGIVAALWGAHFAAFALVAGGLLGVLGSLVGEYWQKAHQLRRGEPFYVLRDLDAEDRASGDREGSETCDHRRATPG